MKMPGARKRRRGPSSVGAKNGFVFTWQSKMLLEVVDRLRDLGEIKSDADFCRVVGYRPSSFNRIRKGQRNVTVDLIVQTCHAWRANPDFILFGNEPILFLNDSMKRDLEREKKRYGGVAELRERMRSLLSGSTYESVFGFRHWHHRITYLASLVTRLEAENVAKSAQIDALNKIISKHIERSLPAGEFE